MGIGMHPLFLGPGGHSHGDVLDRASKRRFHMAFEVGEDDKTIGLIDDSRSLNGKKMAACAFNLDDVTAIETVADHHGATQIRLGKTMVRCRLEAVGPGSPAPRIKDRGIEHEGLDAGISQPVHDFPRKAGMEIPVVPLFPPVNLDPHPLSGVKGPFNALEKTAEGSDGAALDFIHHHFTDSPVVSELGLFLPQKGCRGKDAGAAKGSQR
jgi:hypothetical protein